MVVVLSSYELVNIAYYILLPWDTMSSNDAVAVVAVTSMFGRWAGTIISILVALSCAGSITSNVFTIGRLTVAASQRHYLPSFLSMRGAPEFWHRRSDHPSESDSTPPNGPHLTRTVSAVEIDTSPGSYFDAPMHVAQNIPNLSCC